MKDPHSTGSIPGIEIVDKRARRPRVRVGPAVNHDKKTEIRLRRDGSSVDSIQITCACGEEITLSCIYTDNT